MCIRDRLLCGRLRPLAVGGGAVVPEGHPAPSRRVTRAGRHPPDHAGGTGVPGGASARRHPSRRSPDPPAAHSPGQESLISFHDRLSSQTAYQRFFNVVKHLPATWAHFLVNVDYDRRLALVAEHDGGAGPTLVAVCLLYTSPSPRDS